MDFVYIYIYIHVYMIPFSENIVNVWNNHFQNALVVKMTSILVTAPLSCIQKDNNVSKMTQISKYILYSLLPKAACVMLYRTMHSTL